MKQFILWDEKDGSPRRDGQFVTSGLIGRVGLDNVYLRSYGAAPDGAVSYDVLQVGERVADVVFTLSGQRGVYSVYRVEDSE